MVVQMFVLFKWRGFVSEAVWPGGGQVCGGGAAAAAGRRLGADAATAGQLPSLGAATRQSGLQRGA